MRATGAIRPGFLKGVDDALVAVNLRLPLPASSSSDVDAYGGDGVQLHRAHLELPPPPAHHLFAKTTGAAAVESDGPEGGADDKARGRSSSPSGLARFGWRSSSPKPNAAATAGADKGGAVSPSTVDGGGTAPADSQAPEDPAPEPPPPVKVGHVVLRTANLVAPSLRRDPELLALPWARPAVRGARVELQFTVTGARSLLPLPQNTATNALELAGLNGTNSGYPGGASSSVGIDSSSNSGNISGAPVPTKLTRDPYVVVSWAGREIGKSRVQYRTLEPCWNLRMKFTLTRAEWDSAVEDYNLCAEPLPSSNAYGGDHSPPAPTLMEHFGMLFNAHDSDGSGELDWNEFWEVCLAMRCVNSFLSILCFTFLLHKIPRVVGFLNIKILSFLCCSGSLGTKFWNER